MHNEVVMDPIDRVQEAIRQAFAIAEDDYLYETGVPDDPPEIDWNGLADSICRLVDELRMEVETHGGS